MLKQPNWSPLKDFKVVSTLLNATNKCLIAQFVKSSILQVSIYLSLWPQWLMNKKKSDLILETQKLVLDLLSFQQLFYIFRLKKFCRFTMVQCFHWSAEKKQTQKRREGPIYLPFSQSWRRPPTLPSIRHSAPFSISLSRAWVIFS